MLTRSETLIYNGSITVFPTYVGGDSLKIEEKDIHKQLRHFTWRAIFFALFLTGTSPTFHFIVAILIKD